MLAFIKTRLAGPGSLLPLRTPAGLTWLSRRPILSSRQHQGSTRRFGRSAPMVREINQAGIDLIKGFEGLEDGDPTTVNLIRTSIRSASGRSAGTRDLARQRFSPRTENASRAQALYPGGITLPQAEVALLRADPD
mgnify:CR=1 FL=1